MTFVCSEQWWNDGEKRNSNFLEKHLYNTAIYTIIAHWLTVSVKSHIFRPMYYSNVVVVTVAFQVVYASTWRYFVRLASGPPYALLRFKLYSDLLDEAIVRYGCVGPRFGVKIQPLPITTFNQEAVELGCTYQSLRRHRNLWSLYQSTLRQLKWGVPNMASVSLGE